MMKKVFSILLVMSLVMGLMIIASGCSGSESVKDLKVGDQYQGGIVAYVNSDGKSGLIISDKDIGVFVDWESAMKLCNEYKSGKYNDWYLPTKQELSLVFDNSAAIGSFQSDSTLFKYWSSTEFSEDKAVYMFLGGDEKYTWKTADISHYARAVRKFNN